MCCGRAAHTSGKDTTNFQMLQIGSKKRIYVGGRGIPLSL